MELTQYCKEIQKIILEKYNRIKEGYYFFESVTQNKIPVRDKIANFL